MFADSVRWFCSTTTQGPGGGRNRLVREANAPLVASFDDDSWPLDRDYFAAAAEIFHSQPRAAVLNGQEVRPGMQPRDRDGNFGRIACYQNCACVIRRGAFLGTRGHLPMRYAYGMEEADVALQLLDAGWELLYAPALRVYHDSQLEHHTSKAVNAAHIRNTALLAYLRYPVRYWPLGVLQVLNRARYAASMGRWSGIATGFGQIPGALWRYRKERQPVRAATVALSRQLSRVRP
jgi:GT2 family glycosyltransferase